MNMADAYHQVSEVALSGGKPNPPLEVDHWSEEFMRLPKGLAAKHGRYEIATTPMARRILRVLSPRHTCRRVVIKGAVQMLKTQVAINFLLASAHRAPDTMLVLEPTDSLVKRLSARITKTIEQIPELAGVFAQRRSRDSRNTVAAKDFVGGTMYIATAGSAANLAEMPVRYLFVDEVNLLEFNLAGGGDPVLMAEGRATTHENDCKFLEVSKPTIAGASKICTLYDMGTREIYLVPCPHCGHHHELVIENFHYARDPDTGHMGRAWFVCPECGVEIEERDKQRMLRDEDLGGTAHWFARSVGDGETLSFHVSAFYAQPGSVSWRKLAREHAHAKERLELGDPNAMQIFYNERLALAWENSLELTTAQQLQTRQRDDRFPPRVIPDRALVVTIAVDTQHNRLELQTEAHGPGGEHWVIDYQVLMGSPSAAPSEKGSVWQRLDAYRSEPFLHASGVLIPASVYGIDTGGGNTQDVYNYGWRREQAGCVLMHGSSRPSRPIISSVPSKVDIDHEGNKLPGGAVLWTVGTDVAKDYLFNRMKLKDGPGAMHFHEKLELPWFEGLLSEKVTLKLRQGRFVRVYTKRSNADRNEPLDLSVYNLALSYHLGLHKWSAQDWARLRERLVPKSITPDLFATPLALPGPGPSNPEAITGAGETKPPASETPPPVPETPPQPAVHAHALPATGRRRILNRGI